MSSLSIDTWTPGEVSNWIKGLGSQFEAYYESFVDEEITGKALLTINNEYLKELMIESVSDQNVILDAVHCLVEVDTCLQSETVHGQVVIVNEKAKMLIEQLEKESKDGDEGDVETSENSIKGAGQVYQLAKKLLSWLIRSPFSEMNACWPLKDSVCRVVRDMTDESLLKNRGHLQENLKKLQTSFDNFLIDDEMHEVFKQPPILKTEEITLEGEGLGIGITTSHNIHTVNSVAPESPAGKNKNIKNGDEIVKVNNECVIAWPQKNVVALMKSNADSVTLTLKKLPPVEGPLNKPVDKPGTPLSEMEVIMDRTRITAERTTRAEMKEAGIKEETSLEMQAIENENEVEETSMDKVEERVGEVIEEEPVEAPKEETDGKETEKEGKKDEETEEKSEEKQEEEEVTKEEGETKIEEKQKEEKSEEIGKEDETEKRIEEIKEDEKEEKSKEEKQDEVESKKEEEKVEEQPEEKVIEKVEEKKGDDVEKANGEEMEKSEEGSDKKITVITDVEEGAQISKVVENLLESEDTPEKENAMEETKVDVDLAKKETEKKRDEEKTIDVKEEKEEVPKDAKTTIANGEPSVPVVKIPEESEKIEPKNSKENTENKAAESKTVWYDGDGSSATAKETVKDKKQAKSSASAEVKSPDVKQNGEAETPAPKIEVAPSKGSPEKKPQRPELPKMKIGSVKNVTVKGANTKQVELFSTSKVVRREKKVDGAPSRRISCIDLGEADCEGWLTKKSGGHGLTPTRWKRHWCVLKDGHMYYYKTSFDREAGGVIEIIGYNMSTAPEIKKPFAFKCEKEGAKKYFFHADNEVDREKWVKSLNSTSRGEKKQKDLGSMEQSNGDDRKPSVALKAPASSRPRTSSVLAGIRFNYYDEELGEQNNASHEAPSASATAKRVNDSVESGQREESKNSAIDDTLPNNDVLKIAVPVEEDADTCQVIPVGELLDNKGTVGNSEAPVDKSSTVEGQVGTSEVKSEPKEHEGTLEVKGELKEPEVASEEKRDSEEPKGTSEEKRDSEEPKGTSGEKREPEGTSGVNDEPKEPEVASEEKRDSEEPKSISEVKGEPVEPEGTSEVKSEARGPEGSSEEMSDSKEPEGTSGEEREPVEPKGASEVKKESRGPEGTTEGNGDSREPEGTSEDQREPKELDGTSEETRDLKGQEDTSEDKSESTEPECTSKDNGDSKGREDTTEDKRETEGQSGTCDGVGGENEKAVSVAENVPEKVEASSNSDFGVEEKGETKDNDVSEETRETDAKKSGEGEAEKDEFKEVAESIKEADINIDGSERPSAQALMRRLSTNSKGEILDKVVKLRILKQSLKDKEQSMDAIDELLSSDVTPETIAEWRTKFQTVVESSTSSSDLNENSHL